MFHSIGRKAALSTAVGCVLAAAVALPAQAQTGTNLTLRYSDSQGAGCLTIQSDSTDASSGAAIAVTLTQNGMSLTGQGEEWTLSQNAPRATALAFWLDDGNGDTYFFQGVVRIGVDTLNGEGGWTSIQDPTLTDQWQAFTMFPSRGCS
jgi:hypothetical protein